MPSALASLTKGGLQRRHQVAGDRVRRPRHPGQRRRARRHPDADAPGRRPTRSSPACTRSAGWARSSDVVDAVVYLETAAVRHRRDPARRRRPERRPLTTPWTHDHTKSTILRSVLDQWKAAVDAHEPERVAANFTEDAIFQGLHPYSVGRRRVAEYYDSQPLGMTAEYRILETRRLADDLVLGYLSVDFSFTDRPTLTVYLSVIVRRRRRLASATTRYPASADQASQRGADERSTDNSERVMRTADQSTGQ